ncbi:uncharacterized protein IUM83_05873 [Phytophthora cinnamomi]|uniref:uncharacterized protein n=1 Tax=Phytophthora cinnamomi TaxID=4785 RepID=UPI003559EE40|nr:hypothetical protein IUM83_05873 [Phytophthora cinnamomi]
MEEDAGIVRREPLTVANEQDVGEHSTELQNPASVGLGTFDTDFLVPGYMEMQAGTMEAMALPLSDSGLISHNGEGGTCNQVEDLDMNFLSDLFQPDSSAAVESFPTHIESVELSPTPDSLSSDVAGNSSGTDEVVGAGAGAARPKRAMESLSSGSSSSATPEFVEAGPSGEQEGQLVDRKTRRRAQIASSARRVRSRKKNEMVALKTEATCLEQQLETLRSIHKQLRANSAVAAWEERAIAQRLKRRQAEDLNEQLQQALYAYSGHVKSLNSIFTESAPPSAALNMGLFLHKYTHLRKDPQLRARDLEAVGTAEKLDRAMQVVLRETSTVPATTSPEILFQELNLGIDGLGKTSTAVYAFNTRNAGKAFNVACKAILTTCVIWSDYTCVETSTRFIEVPPTPFNVLYSMSKHRYVHNYMNVQACIETRDLYYSRMIGLCGVMVWDFVDADDLYPLKSSTFIKRNTVGALVLRPEVCPDGVERIVCRSICTEMKNFGNMPRPALKVAESARLEDMLIFEEMKEGATDWQEQM